jgi:purine-binding chemotaxis protein CheW
VSATHVQVRVGREAYALPVTHVLEVLDLDELTPLPGAGGHVLGLRNLRGQVLPVFDLGALLGAGEGTLPARVCVASRNGHVAGLAVDEVTDVSALPDEGEEVDSPLLARSLLFGDRLVGVIDADELFAELDRRGGK